MDSMRDGVKAVRELRARRSRQRHLALVGRLARTALTARLQRFRRAHPAVRLDLHTALSREVSALVRRGVPSSACGASRIQIPT